MLWSKRLQILGFSVIALAGVPWLAACTLTPVYSGRLAESPNLNLAFAKPSTRLDQIVYQELSLRFGKSDSETAPLASVVTSASSLALVNTYTANPNKTYEVTVTATLRITRRDGTDEPPIVLTRQATANYQLGNQILNDNSSSIEAGERAAKAAAESLRLAILAALSR
jgi:LPS-assembly lipoprotein